MCQYLDLWEMDEIINLRDFACILTYVCIYVDACIMHVRVWCMYHACACVFTGYHHYRLADATCRRQVAHTMLCHMCISYGDHMIGMHIDTHTHTYTYTYTHMHTHPQSYNHKPCSIFLIFTYICLLCVKKNLLVCGRIHASGIANTLCVFTCQHIYVTLNDVTFNCVLRALKIACPKYSCIHIVSRHVYQ